MEDAYKLEVYSKDDTIKVLEGRAKVVEGALQKKDDLIVELSARVASAEEMANHAAKNLSSSADLISSMTGSTVEDFLSVVGLEQLLGIELLKDERLNPPTFTTSVAQCMSKIIKAMKVVIEDRVELENQQGLLLADGFGRCHYQLVQGVALGEVDLQQVEVLADKDLFK